MKSIADYDKDILQNSNNAELYRLRGIEYYKIEDLYRAINDFDQAIRIDPNFAQAYINRGNAFELKEDPDRAMADYTKAIQIDPKNADAYFNRGGVYSLYGAVYLYGQNDIDRANEFFDQAITDYNQAIKIDPNNAMVYVNRGMAYNSKENFDRAIMDFNQAIKINPNYASAYWQRGDTYSRDSKGIDKAIADFNKTLQLDPNHDGAYNSRALMYIKRGDYAKAIADWEAVLRLNPDDSTAKMNLEKAKREREKAKKEAKAKIEEIQQRYEQEIRSNPNNAEAYIKRGYDFAARGLAEGGNQVFFDHAIADFTEAIKIDPKATDAYFSRAGVYSQNNDHDRAIADYDQVIQINPNNAEAYAFRGAAYSQNKKYDQALADFNEAIRLNPKCKNAYRFRGVMYFINEVRNKENADYDKAAADVDKAIADIEEAFKLKPDDGAVADLLKKVKNEKEIVDRMRRERQERYDRLVQEMDKASTEEKYQDLAQQLRTMRGYKNSIELANKCDNQYQELRKERECREAAEAEARRRYYAKEKRKEELKKPTGLLLQFGMLFAYLYLLWGTGLIYSIKESVFWNIMLPAVLSLVLGIISRLFLKDTMPKLPWGTVFLVFGLAATTITANVWMGGGVAGGVFFVILALIPVTLVYFMWADSYSSIGSNIGLTLLAVALTAIVGGIISSISENPCIFIFIMLVLPAIPGMIIMHKTEGASW